MHTSKSIPTSQNDIVTESVPVEATDDESTMAQAVLLVDSIMLPMTMLAAIELRLLEIIAGAGHLTAAEVAGKLPGEGEPAGGGYGGEDPSPPGGLLGGELLCDDVAVGEKRRVYGLTPLGRFFVKDEDGVSMAPLLKLMNDKVLLESCYKIKDAVLEGGTPFNMAHGMNAFEYPAVDPKFKEVFNLAMLNQTTILLKKVLQSYNGFENINQLADVGGGVGHTLKIILSKYPNIKGVNFDLPHVTKYGLSHPGMEHMEGDMFEDVPSADAIFMKWILHDWSDEHCIKLLKNCHKAIPKSGKVIVVESVILEELETSNAAKVGSLMALVMMTQAPGGKERTKKEFLALAKEAGFASVRFEYYVSNLWIMEFYK